MPFAQQLQLIAIGIGALFVVLAAVIILFAEEGGCLAVIAGFIGIAFIVYGFTGDPNQLPFAHHG